MTHASTAASAAIDPDAAGPTPPASNDARTPRTTLNAPHGGVLVDRAVDPDEAERLVRALGDAPTWDLTPRQACDLELIVNGAFSPLTGFLGRADYDRVVAEERLADGTLWPIPVTLDVPEALARTLVVGRPLVLRDAEGVPLAQLDVAETWTPDRVLEARRVYGTDDRAHPGVAALLERTHPVYVGGSVRGLRAPQHHDFTARRESPRQLRAWFDAQGWTRVVAFQTRNPLHRAHRELTWRAAQATGAKLLIHPVVGLTKPGDVDHYTRVRCYEAVLPHYPDGHARLSLLPLAMRMAGPREALWHAIIRKNFGVTHFIVGRDHAGPGNDAHGRPFYAPLAAQAHVLAHADEIDVDVVPFRTVAYAANRDAYLPEDELAPGDDVRDLSGTELRRLLHAGDPIPAWYTYPDVAAILRERHPARARRGVVLFFTGLSGAGKSTIAQALIARLLETSARPVTLLDGDHVRKHLSRGLGFSREDRDANVTRIGFVAAEIARHGGIAVCAPIAPYAAARAAVRALVDETGASFVEIHVATPIAVCEHRDRKGLYAQARAGRLTGFTGVDDPYEVPDAPALRLDASASTPAALASDVLAWLRQRELVA